MTCLLIGFSPMRGEDPERWVPARWSGGPLELAQRSKDKAGAPEGAVREAIANWYRADTLDLLKGTPINCLLVTFAAAPDGETEVAQRRLVKEYVRLAHERRLAVLGMVHAGADLAGLAAAANEAGLDGLALDGDFPHSAAADVETAMRATNSAAVVIPLAQEAAAARLSAASLVSVAGVQPNAKDLADEGIRAGPSSEPWIESNIWLVRSFRFGGARRTVWIDHPAGPGSTGDYVRCVADAAAAGGRWIVALDDQLRARLYRNDAEGLAAWRAIANYLNFAEEHAGWRSFAPFGNLGIIFDTKSEYPEISQEYLNLVARRQVPYKVIARNELTSASLDGLRAALAVDLAPAAEQERKLLQAFAERGGLVIAGPSWGGAPADNQYEETPLGKGRVTVYKDEPPDPEEVARDMLELLDQDLMGMTAFNVPSVLTYAAADEGGARVLVQLLNYAADPFDQRITIRLNGTYRKARLFTPENPPVDLDVRNTPDGRTQASAPGLAVWGALLFDH
ncbi:MAG: hypothetical protein KIT09_06290 [Bryobacteraceae bacterium]|nr:hypothetical protein [Bryobacteraceae bacterium]